MAIYILFVSKSTIGQEIVRLIVRDSPHTRRMLKLPNQCRDQNVVWVNQLSTAFGLSHWQCDRRSCKKRTPACRTSHESIGYNSRNNFDLTQWPWSTTLAFDLGDLDPCELDLGPSFLKLGWKLEFLLFWLRWPWPLTYDLDLQTCPRYDGP